MACKSCEQNKIGKAIKGVSKGIAQLAFPNNELEGLAKDRLTKCYNCEFSKIIIQVKSKQVIQCTKCKCICELKVRVKEESCPIGRW